MANVRVGISGWRYPPWRGTFYPDDLPQHRELWFASRALTTIEINGSFYALQTPASYERWYEDTPKGFVFSLKAPRFITHIRRLRDIEKPLANFLASGILNLREKLGPILWQFPPSFKYDRALFSSFLDMLPRDTRTALKLARGRESRMLGRSRLAIDRNRRMRHAIEIRNNTFEYDAFITDLRRRNIALVVADAAHKWPYLEDITADFMYLRLHGHSKTYASGYTRASLAHWASRIRLWREGREPKDARHAGTASRAARKRDVYCYFDNDVKIKAPMNAQSLQELLKK